MAYYRLYHVSDGHFCRVEEIDAQDDPQAVGQAASSLDTGAAELWCGRRRVKIFGQQSESRSRRTGSAEPVQAAR